MKQVLCIRWGTKYGAEYVNRLYGMVARHLTPPFSFHCVTDDTGGLRPEIEVIPLPPLGCEMPRNTPGIWGKSRLWAEELGGLSGPVLFLDLDLVVTGSLDAFFEVGAPDDVILARNPNTPFEKLGQTSIFRFPIGKLAPLRAAFLADPQGTADRYRWEQRYVTRTAPGGVSFWPKGWVAHFRHHLVPPFPVNLMRPPRLPAATRVVIFPGGLNPPDALAGRWNGDGPVRGALAHVAAGLRGERTERLDKHLRHYVRPTPWIAEHWRE
ncbi:hypothetical protein [Wenxinia marina]|uniref:Glycosyl transferase n=1 Tax=Wenxinia marina DSM 24838 TaxID=1123501 RepID=A0A0D0PEE5_9RHOB|nr:hypothetical protein [Wenxinia marina]KIQ69771.1 hypothetical protein Wenmar_01341 [Wenxinia marina DSM 24838]GGL61025.1 hypothetical protein GCM10011392_14410 [Wenxinia marina]